MMGVGRGRARRLTNAFDQNLVQIFLFDLCGGCCGFFERKRRSEDHFFYFCRHPAHHANIISRYVPGPSYLGISFGKDVMVLFFLFLLLCGCCDLTAQEGIINIKKNPDRSCRFSLIFWRGIHFVSDLDP